MFYSKEVSISGRLWYGNKKHSKGQIVIILEICIPKKVLMLIIIIIIIKSKNKTKLFIPWFSEVANWSPEIHLWLKQQSLLCESAQRRSESVNNVKALLTK